MLPQLSFTEGTVTGRCGGFFGFSGRFMLGPRVGFSGGFWPTVGDGCSLVSCLSAGVPATEPEESGLFGCMTVGNRFGFMGGEGEGGLAGGFFFSVFRTFSLSSSPCSGSIGLAAIMVGLPLGLVTEGTASRFLSTLLSSESTSRGISPDPGASAWGFTSDAGLGFTARGGGLPAGFGFASGLKSVLPCGISSFFGGLARITVGLSFLVRVVGASFSISLASVFASLTELISISCSRMPSGGLKSHSGSSAGLARITVGAARFFSSGASAFSKTASLNSFEDFLASPPWAPSTFCTSFGMPTAGVCLFFCGTSGSAFLAIAAVS